MLKPHGPRCPVIEAASDTDEACGLLAWPIEVVQNAAVLLSCLFASNVALHLCSKAQVTVVVTTPIQTILLPRTTPSSSHGQHVASQ
eukprot:CAMPEP_0175870294 /NCGR_PEP_ID=MMETSP0107_2-20121207/36473_1 /TAXON_ID=195067 ORGANISM="Goniomonas pacifica, Strain CCMP1869" /NCGR_SAMPLE_ID=MMETSP0107_2 /ASSEMBLY_ACC=CAM_ASM_000203 /LENGTH=86 /DNA_ID=CAMNT_0017188493 /DNA_START=116 /DNA_END=375 /DNA_ORIENTATION=+